MNIEKKITDFIKSENPKLEISGLRGLVKSGENEWSFRYTYRDGDFLSISKLVKIKLEGIKKIPTFVAAKKIAKKQKANDKYANKRS